jgi:hypothetical protein
METIVAAIISAVASVIVALISRGTPPAQTDRTSETSEPSALSPHSARKGWTILLAVLVPWIVLSPPLIHHDFPGINLFVIVGVTILASAVWPIRPLPAAAIVLALHPVNFFMEPVARMIHHMLGPMSGLDSSKITFLVSIFFANALAVAGICYWRRKSSFAMPLTTSAAPVRKGEEVPQSTSGVHASTSLASELKGLASLHAEGKLSDEEFRRAKERLLG